MLVLTLSVFAINVISAEHAGVRRVEPNQQLACQYVVGVVGANGATTVPPTCGVICTTLPAT